MALNPSYVGADAGKYTGEFTYSLVNSTKIYNGVSYECIEIVAVATDLTKYTNGVGVEGYWAGFHVAIPAGATKLYRSYTGYTDVTTFEALMQKPLSEYTDLAADGDFQSYPDHQRQKERWVRLQWQDDEGTIINETIYYWNGKGITMSINTTSDGNNLPVLDKEGLSTYTRAIFSGVNTRITQRIVDELSESSDDNHVATAKAVYDEVSTRSKIRTLINADGTPRGMAITPDANTTYYVRTSADATEASSWYWDATLNDYVRTGNDEQIGDGTCVEALTTAEINEVVAAAFEATDPMPTT